MKTVAVILFWVSAMICWSITLDQQKLNKLYEEENPLKRDTSLLSRLTEELMPQINVALDLVEDSVKYWAIYQTLNAWRGSYYIPIIRLELGAKRYIVRDFILLRDIMHVINLVRQLWPQQREWQEIEVELYFSQLYLHDGDLLRKAFPQQWYKCALKETFSASDGDSTYQYRPCVSINIDMRKWQQNEW